MSSRLPRVEILEPSVAPWRCWDVQVSSQMVRVLGPVTNRLPCRCARVSLEGRLTVDAKSQQERLINRGRFARNDIGTCSDVVTSR